MRSLWSALVFPGSSDCTESAYNAGDWIQSLGWEDPLAENPMDGEAW